MVEEVSEEKRRRREEVSHWKRGWEATSRPTTPTKAVAPRTNHIKRAKEKEKRIIEIRRYQSDIVNVAYGTKEP